MRLLFVRHAEPDYAIDSITPKGRVEAELLSERLRRLDVTEFYCSPLGRAKETARYTLDKLGRAAEIMPWLAEFRGRVIDPSTGMKRMPWDFPPRIWTENKPLLVMDTWLTDPIVAGGNTEAIYRECTEGLDGILGRHGYIRDGLIYRCADNRPRTLVFFCHFGISMAMLSHLCGIAPMVLWHCFCALPSSVTSVVSEERVRGEVFFRCTQLGDISHLYAGGEAASTAGLFPECYNGKDSTDPKDYL